MKITAEILLKIAPQAKHSVVEGLAQFMTNAFIAYGIDTEKEVKYFLGQAAHETDGFKTLTEYASGRAYNGREDLGNRKGTHDGETYRGRGIFQITGRFNYEKYGKKLGKDLINHPELAASPEIAILTACEYWRDRGLSKYAEADDIKGLTKRINGGYNGLDSREIYTARAAKLLPQIFA